MRMSTKVPQNSKVTRMTAPDKSLGVGVRVRIYISGFRV
jgi:hypothetical protein